MIRLVLLLLAGASGYALLCGERGADVARRWDRVEQDSAAEAERTLREAAPLERAAGTKAAAAPASKPSESPSASSLDEPSLMAKLRRLTVDDPESALRLAREANARFPHSPGAAERAWIVVKSLDSLKRFHEGQSEARIMLERYPGASWAADVERHTLVYPLDQPSREVMQVRLQGLDGRK